MKPTSRIVHVANHLERRVRIERLRDSLLNLDLVVDDARSELLGALARLRDATRERDEAIQSLLAAIHAEIAA